MVLLAVFIFASVESCHVSSSRGEELSRTYCGSCHVFPEPSLLDKKSWAQGVLPQMAFRMGFPDLGIVSRIAPAELSVVMETIPNQPMVTQEEWNLIYDYYVTNAPDSLSVDPLASTSLTQFSVRKADPGLPFITLLKYDADNDELYIGNQQGTLLRLSRELDVLASVQFGSAPSHIEFRENHVIVLLMGKILPHDLAYGSIVELDKTFSSTNVVIDSLQRPVHFITADLNSDATDEFIVSEFGNYTGVLSVHILEDSTFLRRGLEHLPGARKANIVDFNGDGRKDILALLTQGDEKLVLYENKGNLNFEPRVLLRFTPVFGSSYFETVDFNNDGFEDILLCNGDNADFSMVLKPYHGVRLFVNDGNWQFSEAWHLPLPGASQAAARDFDLDGDLDIAAISYFPDFENSPEFGFVYFENVGDSRFEMQTSPLGAAGRWLVMDIADIDSNGSEDVLLGALSVSTVGASQELYRQWVQQRAPVLILENIGDPPEGRNTQTP